MLVQVGHPAIQVAMFAAVEVVGDWRQPTGHATTLGRHPPRVVFAHVAARLAPPPGVSGSGTGHLVKCSGVAHTNRLYRTYSSGIVSLIIVCQLPFFEAYLPTLDDVYFARKKELGVVRVVLFS